MLGSLRLAQDERRGDGVHRGLQRLDDVGEGHGHGAQGRHGGHLAGREGGAHGRQLQQLPLLQLGRQEQPGAPHEESDGDAGRQPLASTYRIIYIYI